MGNTLQMKPRVVVADDNTKVLQAVVAVLSVEFDVVATASDGRSALNHIQRLHPEVAVLDLNMPELNGLEVTREIMRLHLESSVVICSVENDPELIATTQAAGALGYVLKPKLNQDLVIAVRYAASGQGFISCS